MSVSTGRDIEALCNKCGDVWHVIVAMVGSKIAKVQCKECGAYHRYRDPSGKSSGATSRRRSSSGAKTASKTPKQPQPTVEADTSKPIRPYSPREQYDVAERIDHPKFGIGVVQATVQGKTTVFFTAEGMKVLATAKPGPKLTRPPRFRD